MNKLPRLALCAAGLSFTLSGVAWAALSEVDPGPYTLATGRYPMWYKDSTDLSLELCQSRAASSRVAATVPPAYMCTLLPEPGIYDDALPLDPSTLRADALVCEAVMRAGDTPLLAAARLRGCRVHHGQHMIYGQIVQICRFLGVDLQHEHLARILGP